LSGSAPSFRARSTGEATAYPREAVEAALARRLQDRAEAAYARGDLFAERRKLMEDWGADLAAAERSAPQRTGIMRCS
jgi:hypothetical protein